MTGRVPSNDTTAPARHRPALTAMAVPNPEAN